MAGRPLQLCGHDYSALNPTPNTPTIRIRRLCVEHVRLNPETTTAKDVAEHLLETTGTALMSGEFELFLSCFLLPNEICTSDGCRMIRTAEDLRDMFDGVRQHFRVQNVTHLIRNCIGAEFIDPDTIRSTHVSRLVSGTLYCQEPYPVISTVNRTGGAWLISHSEYAIVGEPLHVRALSG